MRRPATDTLGFLWALHCSHPPGHFKLSIQVRKYLSIVVDL